MVPFILYQEAVDENENRNAVRILRLHLRETQDPFGIPDIVFKNFYRLPKALVQELIADIEPAMEVAQRVTAIPNHLKVLAFLSVVANGGYQKNVGHDFLLALSQTTVSRCIDLVARAIQNILAPRRIVFPVGAHEKTVIKTKFVLQLLKLCCNEIIICCFRFYNKFRFPGIIGAIDGTHIRIQKPDQQVEHVYYNGRKGAHTKNVQIVCS